MNNKSNLLTLIIGIIIGIGLMYFFKTYSIEKKSDPSTEQSLTQLKKEKAKHTSNESFEKTSVSSKEESGYSDDITTLTQEKIVIQYIQKNHRLPEYYITKSEARKQGWEPSKGNLCDVLPGKAIGGDRFSNREGTLPKGVQYFEADINYHCGHRQADRLVYTKNGDVWVTHNHYKTFQKQ